MGLCKISFKNVTLRMFLMEQRQLLVLLTFNPGSWKKKPLYGQSMNWTSHIFFNRTVFFFERTENWQKYIDPMWLHDIHFLKMNSVHFSFQGKQHRICRDNKIESFKQNLVFGRVSVCSHDLTFFQKVHLLMRSVVVLQMFYMYT